MIQQLLSCFRDARLVDLAQPYFPGMPHWPSHPPFALARTKEHGDYLLPGGASSAAELIALGTHTGTHIDGLGHFSCAGRFFHGAPFEHLGIDTLVPILRRGVFCDLAPGGELPQDHAVSAAQLQAALQAPVQPGDVVLLRTGWGRRWRTPRLFLNQQQQPGLALDAARWLSSRSIFAAGADNVALERIPSPSMEVHLHLLAGSGIHILECLDLEPLAAARATEFIFLGAPLKIEGATGAPIRPFALLPPL